MLEHSYEWTYEIQSRTASYRATSWCLSYTNTDPHPKHTKGVSELRKFFAVGTVSNSPHSYSIQSSLFSSNFNDGMVLQKKSKKMTWPKSTWGRKHDLTNSQAKHVQTLIELAGIYQHLNPEVATDLAQWSWRTKRKTHEEGSSSSSSHEEAKSQLLQFCSKHVQTLIQSAGIYQDSSPEVASDLAQWLSRSTQKTHEEGSSSWGGLLIPWGGQNQLLQFCSKHVQTLIQSAGIYQDSSPEVTNDLVQWLSRSTRKTHEEGSSSSWWGGQKWTSAIRLSFRWTRSIFGT